MNKYDLSGKRALVTGGSRGIGKAIATMLKSSGAEVVISGSNEENLKTVASELSVEYIVADLSDNQAIDGLIEKLNADGGVDILVNNAGITKDGLFIRQKDDVWNDVIQVNLNATVKITRGVTKAMMKNGYGRIINVSSVVAHMGNAGQTNYVASKAAITGFSKSLAKEIGRKGVTVNCIAPGFIESAMTEKLPEKVRSGYMEQIPANRFGSAQEIASAVAFLASEDASYINGTTVHVNGGMY